LQGVSQEAAVQPLVDTLDESMSHYHKRLLHRNFVRYLQLLFKFIVTLLHTTAIENVGVSR
jgi:hypothetical protein